MGPKKGKGKGKKGRKGKEEAEPEDGWMNMRYDQLEISVQNLREKL